MFAPMQRCTGGVDVVWDLCFFGLIDNWVCLGFLVWVEALRWILVWFGGPSVRTGFLIMLSTIREFGDNVEFGGNFGKIICVIFSKLNISWD